MPKVVETKTSRYIEVEDGTLQRVPPKEIVGKMLLGFVTCKATDGCVVTLDGRCPHGRMSWPSILGLV